MQTAGILIVLVHDKDILDIGERHVIAVIAHHLAAYHDKRGAAVGFAGIADIGPLVLVEARMQLDVKQAGLATPAFALETEKIIRLPDRIRQIAVPVTHAQRTGIALGHQKFVIGDEGDGPRMLKITDDGVEGESLVTSLDRFLGKTLSAQQQQR